MVLRIGKVHRFLRDCNCSGVTRNFLEKEIFAPNYPKLINFRKSLPLFFILEELDRDGLFLFRP